MFSNRLQSRLFWTTGALLLIALSRFLLMPALSFDQDEVWSAWLTFGTLPDVISRTDTNWSAWFNVLTYIWRVFVGYHPYVIRLLPFMLFMLSAAFTYQLGYKLYKSHDAALLGLLAYAGLGYVVFLSLYLRPYALAVMLMPLGLILLIRYFEKPGFKRALALGLHMAAMFYVSIMAIFPFMVFAGFSLALYGRKVWRWWLVGLIAAVVALPEIVSKLQIVSARASVVFETNLPPLPEALLAMFGEYTGPAFVIWLILIGIALFFILRFAHQYRWLFLWLLIWAVLGTALLYWLHPRAGLFRPRYAWWIAWAIPLWLAYGLSRLPLWGKRTAALILLALSFVVSPDRIAAYKEPIPDIETLFEWFKQHYQAGDMIVIDPNTRMAYGGFRTEVWDYYVLAFFDNGLHVVDSPAPSQNRVWYLHTSQSVDESLERSVQSGRIQSIFYGSPGFQIQLYEGAPSPEGLLFANGLRFHGVQILDGEGLANLPLVMPKGSQLRLRLWWTVDEPLSQEYSVGIKVMSENWEGIYAQQDSAPQAIYLLPIFNETQEPFGNMTTWQPGQYYVEERLIELPYVPRLQRTEFTVYMTVYQWQDGTRIPADDTNDENLLPLFDFMLMAW
jgi:hypothetical protein